MKKIFGETNQQMVDEIFMSEAIKEAEKASLAGDWPIGCVITIDNKIVSRGRNKCYSKHNRLHHAEIDAMAKIKNLLEENGKKATVYVTFEPCPMCTGALLLNHIGRLVHGPNIDNSGGLHHLNSKPIRYSTTKYDIKLVSGVLDKECKEVFLKGEPTKKIIGLINNI